MMNLSQYPLTIYAINKIKATVDPQDQQALKYLVDSGICNINFDGKEVKISVKVDQLEKLLEAEFGQKAV